MRKWMPQSLRQTAAGGRWHRAVRGLSLVVFVALGDAALSGSFRKVGLGAAGASPGEYESPNSGFTGTLSWTLHRLLL